MMNKQVQKYSKLYSSEMIKNIKDSVIKQVFLLNIYKLLLTN